MISNRCYYALRAMLEMTLREGHGAATIGDIASAQNIPVRFLEAIVRELKQAHLADSIRGKEGGYFLAKKSSSITVGQVINLFEGPLVAVHEAPRSKAHPSDVFSGVWRDAEAALAGVYNKVTFAELAEKERARTLAQSANYTI